MKRFNMLLTVVLRDHLRVNNGFLRFMSEFVKHVN
jgi:UDP-3-O-acyl-N-acetylglucosamine deacetylase